MAEQSSPRNCGNQRCHNAAFYCNHKEISRIIKDCIKRSNYSELLQVNAFGANALHCLIRSKKGAEMQVQTFSALFSESVPETVKENLLLNEDKDQFSALDKAAFEGRTELFDCMINAYLNFREKPKDLPVTSTGRTLLHSAAYGGHLKLVSMVLDKHKELGSAENLIDKQDQWGYTALHLAATRRYSDVATFLINKGASLTITNKLGEPALVYVVSVTDTKEAVRSHLNASVKFDKSKLETRTRRKDVKVTFNEIIVGDRGTETRVLASLVKLDSKYIEDFILHPVCSTFIELKLQRLRGYCYLDLFLYFMLLVFFTYLMTSSGAIQTSLANDKSNMTESINRMRDSNFPLTILTTVFAVISASSSFGFLAFYLKNAFSSNFRKQVASWKGRFTTSRGVQIDTRTNDQSVNWGEHIPLNSRDTGGHVIDIEPESLMPIRHLKNEGSTTLWFGFLTTTADLLIYISVMYLVWTERSSPIISVLLLIMWAKSILRFKVFFYCGRYIMIFEKVLFAFFRFFITFSPVFIGFALALSASVQKHPSFILPNSFISVLVMITGEYNFDEKLEVMNDLISKLVFVNLVFLLSIVLMNLWVGLSVSDVSELVKSADVRLAKHNVERIILAEEVGEFLKGFGFDRVSKQLTLFDDKTKLTIDLSLRKPNTNDLLYQHPTVYHHCQQPKGSNFWPGSDVIIRHLDYFAFCFWAVRSNTLLYRKFPIHTELQDRIERIAVDNAASAQTSC